MAAGHGMAWTSEQSGSVIAVEAFGTMLARGSMPGPASCAHSTLSAAAGAVAAKAERSGLAAALDRGCGRGGLEVGKEAGQHSDHAGLLLLLLSKAAAAAAAAAWGVEGGKVLRGWLLLLF